MSEEVPAAASAGVSLRSQGPGPGAGEGRPRCLGLGPLQAAVGTPEDVPCHGEGHFPPLPSRCPDAEAQAPDPRAREPGDEGLVCPVQQCSGPPAFPWMRPSCLPPAGFWPHTGHVARAVDNEGGVGAGLGLPGSESAVAWGGAGPVLAPSLALSTLPPTLLPDPWPQPQFPTHPGGRALKTQFRHVGRVQFPY